MGTTMPTRIDGELFEAAKLTGVHQSRSAAQQIDHWARIGRELEASPTVSHRDVAHVLAGRAPYDALGEPEQAVVRAAWDEEIRERIASLDLAAEFEAEGETSWVETDESGEVVRADGRG